MSARRTTDPAAGRASAQGADPSAGVDPALEALGFDAALAALQETVAALEGGGQQLEETIALYARGVALHERCSKLLAEAELRVRVLGERAGGAIRPASDGEEEADDAER